MGKTDDWGFLSLKLPKTDRKRLDRYVGLLHFVNGERVSRSEIVRRAVNMYVDRRLPGLEKKAKNL